MAQWHILVVDDEPDICEILRFNLEAAGYAVNTACSAEEAMSMNLGDVDLLLLDVMMPGMSGYEMAQRVDVPIIFLTAKGEEEDKLEGFRLGADDYITKPFSVREVMARVKAVLSRIGGAARNEGVELNAEAKTALVDGKPILLPDFVVTARTVDVNITRLRKKLGPYAARIVARQGYGYVYEL